VVCSTSTGELHERVCAPFKRRMLHYVIGGLELTPNIPTFVQARDGIIAAVSAIDGTDLRPVWNGFAKRGMGSNAAAPASTSFDLTGVQESSSIPDGLPDDEEIAVLCAVDQLL
jgi:Fungalysin metallopeptidase (M36)